MSGTLQAEEIVFTTLAVEYSPSNRGGYQFVYVAPGLSEADRETILGRVSIFGGTLDGPARWQFFSLPGERSAVVRTQAIPPDAEISDQRGSFLAYGAVLSAAEFARVSFDPFQVLDALPFPQTAQEVVERYGHESRPPAKIELTAVDAAFLEEPWPSPALRNLLALTLAAEALVAARRTVVIHGPADARLQALRLALKLTPQTSRSACTFDTEGNSHLARNGGLWAVGMDEPPRGADVHPHIDANLHKVRGEIPSPPPRSSASLYGQWFDWVTSQEARSQPFSASLAAKVEALAVCLDSGSPVPEELELDEKTAGDLDRLWPEEVRAALRRRLANHTSEAIATAVIPWLADNLPVKERFALALQGTAASLAAQLTTWVLTAAPKLVARDWARLADLGRQAAAPVLTALASVLGRLEKEERRAALAALDGLAFERLLPLCPERIAPHLLVHPAHIVALIEWVADRPLEDDLLRDLIEEALLAGQGAGLNRISGRIFQMSARSQQRHHRWLEKHPDAACPWRRQLGERAALPASQAPWWRRLLSGKRPPASRTD